MIDPRPGAANRVTPPGSVIEAGGVAGALAVWMIVIAAAPAGAAEPAVLPSETPAAPKPAIKTPLVITWSAPEGCPSADTIRGEVRRMAGPAAAATDQIEAHATVVRDHGGWQLTLTTRAGALAGERKLGASDCAELGRAATLVIALMVNPAADPAAAPMIRPAAPPPPVPTPPPEPPRERRFSLGADLRVGSGDLPDGAAGIGIRFAAGGGLFSAQARGDLWLPRDAASAAKPSAGGSFGAADLSLAACATARSATAGNATAGNATAGNDRRLAPAICLGAALIGTHASGSGVSDPGSTTAISAGPFLEGALRVRISARNALRAGIEALAPLSRPSFALAGVGTVFRPSALSLRASLGWELNF
jgi:hypothetical protein